jgi:hypothetical protein
MDLMKYILALYAPWLRIAFSTFYTDVSQKTKKQSFLFTHFFFLFAVLGLELRAFTLSHSTSPIFVEVFLRYDLAELFA